MPYSLPNSPTLRTHSQSRRRFSDSTGSGAFAPITALPRRRISAAKQHHVFHLGDDHDDDDSPEDEQFPKLRQQHIPFFADQKPAIRLTPPTTAVPFPRASPTSPSSDEPIDHLHTRSSSHPVLLANGKPLKSSLKSSSSAPTISTYPRAVHLRARSAPSTPHDEISVCTPKNVHFAEKDGLATVRVFNRSAKPASLSHPTAGDDTETETDSEFSSRTSFPFPRFPTSPPPPATHSFQIDYSTPGATYSIPAHNPPPYANVHLESLHFPPPPSPSHHKAPFLTGTLLVRNVAYEKQVALRFTLDDWQTTSEVLARHVSSLSDLPLALAPRTPGDTVGALASSPHSWDRFAFTIRLEDYAHKLNERVLWIVARFTTPAGEWWDNNSGSNYRVGFRPSSPPPTASAGPPKRAHALSAPGKYCHSFMNSIYLFTVLRSSFSWIFYDESTFTVICCACTDDYDYDDIHCPYGHHTPP